MTEVQTYTRDIQALLEEVFALRAERDALRDQVVTLSANVERLQVLGPDTEARITCEARALAATMMQPAFQAWREDNERLRSKLDQLERDEPDGWLTHSPDGLEWHDSRTEAEAYILQWFEDDLQVNGEGREDTGLVLRVVAHTREVVAATAEDDTAEGAECRERQVDYWISGYEIHEGSGTANGFSHV